MVAKTAVEINTNNNSFNEKMRSLPQLLNGIELLNNDVE